MLSSFPNKTLTMCLGGQLMPAGTLREKQAESNKSTTRRRSTAIFCLRRGPWTGWVRHKVIHSLGSSLRRLLRVHLVALGRPQECFNRGDQWIQEAPAPSDCLLPSFQDCSFTITYEYGCTRNKWAYFVWPNGVLACVSCPMQERFMVF